MQRTSFNNVVAGKEEKKEKIFLLNRVEKPRKENISKTKTKNLQINY